MPTPPRTEPDSRTVEIAGLAAAKEPAPPTEVTGGAATAVPAPVPPSQTDLARSARESLLGQYLGPREIGCGGICRVYAAEDAGLKRQVAVKILRTRFESDPVFRQRLVREGRLTAKVKCDHVVAVYRIARGKDGRIYLVMPLLVGESLAERLARQPRPPLEVTLKVAEQMAAALAACHARGVVHRDIKPTNVWLEVDPNSPCPATGFSRCILFDFGFAKEIRDPISELTRTQQLLGTPEFMPPEQAQSGRKAGPPADVFSLGVMLYRMASGQKPYPDAFLAQAVAARYTDAPPPLPARRLADIDPLIPVEFSDLVGRMVSTTVGARPTAVDVLDALGTIRTRGGPTAVTQLPSGDWRSPAEKPAERSGGTVPWKERIAVALVTAVATLLVAWVFTALRG